MKWLALTRMSLHADWSKRRRSNTKESQRLIIRQCHSGIGKKNHYYGLQSKSTDILPRGSCSAGKKNTWFLYSSNTHSAWDSATLCCQVSAEAHMFFETSKDIAVTARRRIKMFYCQFCSYVPDGESKSILGKTKKRTICAGNKKKSNLQRGPKY